MNLYHSINLDITHRCLLQCPKCMRQKFPGLHKRGSDISLDSISKISNSFKNILFCGQMGDPIYHPKFLQILDICKKNNVSISTNGHGKNIDWWDQAAFISSNQSWIFGLDGLPSESHLYRIGQDGKSVFSIMKYLASLGCSVTWQYIVFKYNQNSILEAKKLANDNNINFVLIESSRWDEPYDKYKPDFHYKNRPQMS
jgi:MoaA/NifB/PqqE/SkfB family radical SAM enzyme